MKIKKNDSIIELSDKELARMQLTGPYTRIINPDKFKENLINLFKKADVDADALTLSDLHKVREKIQQEKNEEIQMSMYEERTGRTFLWPLHKKFSRIDEQTILQMIKEYFPENLINKTPSEKMLSDILGTKCHVVNIKFLENIRIEFDFVKYNQDIRDTLTQLGAVIMYSDYDRFDNKVSVYVAKYNFVDLNKNIANKHRELFGSEEIKVDDLNKVKIDNNRSTKQKPYWPTEKNIMTPIVIEHPLYKHYQSKFQNKDKEIESARKLLSELSACPSSSTNKFGDSLKGTQLYGYFNRTSDKLKKDEIYVSTLRTATKRR